MAKSYERLKKKKNYVKRMENKFEMLPHAVETKIFCKISQIETVPTSA